MNDFPMDLEDLVEQMETEELYPDLTVAVAQMGQGYILEECREGYDY